MAIEVQIRQPTTGTVRVLRFSTSPVRLGRNQLNDIPLDDPFVSEWHGIIRADGQQLAYFDLGSTNGTIFDGRRLAKNAPALLGPGAQLSIGTLVLTVVVVNDASGPIDVRAQRRGTGPAQTLGWGSSAPRTPAAPSPHPADPRGPETPPPPSSRAEARAPSRGDYPPSGPLPHGSAPSPQVQRPHASAPNARNPGLAESSDSGLLARQMKYIEAFSEAFVGLRKGYEQFGAEVGVRTVSGTTALHRARTARELVDHLMQATTDPETTSRDLIAIFADFGIHHIALMEGITQGVRAMLKSLDPRSNRLDPTGRLWSAAKAKSQWKDYLEQFDTFLGNDEELHAAIFGDGFARAYASVATGSEASGNQLPPKTNRNDRND